MQRSQIGARKGHKRTRAEIAEMRARIDAEFKELVDSGMSVSQAHDMAEANERARRDEELLERDVAAVLAEQLMAKEVDGVEVSEEDVARMENKGIDVEAIGEKESEPLDPLDDARQAGVREIVEKLVGDDITLDQRRLMPTLQMTWGDVDASGQGAREWDRMAEENEAWYQAFAVYLHMPPLERGVGAAFRSWSQLIGRLRKSKAVPPEWYRAAQKYAWEVRAEKYDASRTQRFIGKMEMAEDEVENELMDALITTLRKCVERIKTGRLEEIPMASAIREIPNLIEQIRKQLGIGDANKLTLDALMEALPVQFRQQVLLAINIGTVTVDGRGVERSYDGSHMRSHPLADLSLPDRSLERELKELEEIEGQLKEVQKEVTA